MKTEYIGLEKINGPLVFLKTPKDLSFNEEVEIILANGETRIGNVIILDEEVTAIQVYEGSNDISLGRNEDGIKGQAFNFKAIRRNARKSIRWNWKTN